MGSEDKTRIERHTGEVSSVDKTRVERAPSESSGAKNPTEEAEHPVVKMILSDTNPDWDIPLIPPKRLTHWRKVCKQVYHRNASVACHLLVAAQRAWRVMAMRGLAIQLMILMEAAGFGPATKIAQEVGISREELKRAARLITNVQGANTGGALSAPQGKGAGIKPLGPRRRK